MNNYILDEAYVCVWCDHSHCDSCLYNVNDGLKLKWSTATDSKETTKIKLNSMYGTMRRNENGLD